MRLRIALLLLIFLVTLGCEKKKDLNKDLKPIDPNTPKPQLGSDNPGGAKDKGKADRPPSAIQ